MLDILALTYAVKTPCAHPQIACATEAAEAAAELENDDADELAPADDGVQAYLQALWEAEHIPGESDGPDDDENWPYEQVCCSLSHAGVTTPVAVLLAVFV